MAPRIQPTMKGAAKKRPQIRSSTCTGNRSHIKERQRGEASACARAQGLTPPCPGKKLPLSLTPTARLTNDSMRSPHWVSVEQHRQGTTYSIRLACGAAIGTGVLGRGEAGPGVGPPNTG